MTAVYACCTSSEVFWSMSVERAVFPVLRRSLNRLMHRMEMSLRREQHPGLAGQGLQRDIPEPSIPEILPEDIMKTG